MSTAKIAITIDDKLVEKIDSLVRKRIFPSRSRAIQEAVSEKLSRLDKSRLAKECSKLDIASEQHLAEEGTSSEIESWPEY
ncbi:ribbon-helix-helix protein, CopG family [candidate division KSB1 bacterium]|nr:ribbon-helix-helix protein, CopG family [candidate division KSB1 bacterium]RQW09603.1 MAG: ribbon-helix-helix protein, CopG family [candidate division KSB1 bacterium]